MAGFLLPVEEVCQLFHGLLLGLMVGVKTTAPAAEVVNRCMDRGVLCLTAKDKVRLLPALNIPMEDLAYAMETLKAVARELG